MPSFEKGLVELGEGLHAYLLPDGSWGLSNAGLIQGEGASLLVDTLFDLRLTREMLDAMDPLTSRAPIATLVNTHANGDHCWGNQLVGGAEVIASKATAEEMSRVTPAMMRMMVSVDFGPVLTPYLRERFGLFDFDGIEVPPPTRTFDGRIDLEVGGRRVEVIEVGPAHTDGDTLVHVPDARTVFTGDILFIGGTPIVWAGPVRNWVAACDRILALDAETIVPGHGPLSDRRGVEAVKRYLEFVWREASERKRAGMSALEAARDIELGEYADWGASERIVVNVDSIYRELDPQHPPANVLGLFLQMAEMAKR
ncbi:cyclase [Myxococcaceae bacterium]|jgi:glyoxylase-like metal-dependent hydrolase (beta-lactamase superfamily II)|nr:cyclase [Myxococcaceae bacterium]